MPRVVCFGEAVVDLVPEPSGGTSPPVFRQHAGGAPANVAVAVARLEGRAGFAGGIAPDPFGDFLLDALRQEGVETEDVTRPPGTRTALAVVSLDRTGERSFRFCAEDPAHLAYRPAKPPRCGRDTVWHFGSNTLTTEASARTTLDLLRAARTQGALLSCDLNWRPALWPRETAPGPRVWAALEEADLLKLSREEFDRLAEDGGGRDAILGRLLGARVRLVVVTDGPRPVSYFSDRGTGRVPAWSVTARDTTAAGDAFWGGLLARLLEGGDPHETLAAWLGDFRILEDALRHAAAGGALAATRAGSFAAMPRKAEVARFLEQRRP